MNVDTIDITEIIRKSEDVHRKVTYIRRKSYESKYDAFQEAYSLTQDLMDKYFDLKEVVLFKDKAGRFRDLNCTQDELKEHLRLGTNPTEIKYMKGLNIKLKKENCHDILIEATSLPSQKSLIMILTGVGNIPYHTDVGFDVKHFYR